MKSTKKSGQSAGKKAKAGGAGKKVSVFPQVVSNYNEQLWLKIYKIGLLAMALIMIGLALNSGLNADEEFQYDYSSKLVDYYSSFGKNEAALNIEKGNMHYYGGLFDTVTGFLNGVFGFDQSNLVKLELQF